MTFPAQDTTPETWGQCGAWGGSLSGQIEAGLPAEPTLLTTASGYHDQGSEGLRDMPILTSALGCSVGQGPFTYRLGGGTLRSRSPVLQVGETLPVPGILCFPRGLGEGSLGGWCLSWDLWDGPGGASRISWILTGEGWAGDDSSIFLTVPANGVGYVS